MMPAPMRTVFTLALAASLLAATKTPKEPMKDDAVLEKLKAALPKGWRMTREPNRVVLEGDQLLWALPFNRINAPPTWGADARRQWEAMKKTTPATHAQVVLRCEPKWSAQRIEEARKKNEAVRAANQPPAPKTKGPSKADWAAARSHDGELEKKLEKLPWSSDTCSLFLERLRGIEDELTVVFPEEAARDAFAAWKAIRDVLEPLQVK